MADAIHPYNYPPSEANDFERKGHPGKWLKSISVSGTQWYTGSNYGVGAIVTYGTPTGTAYLSGGGTIALANLTVGNIHELSIEHIEGGSDAYVLVRNQVIR
jgi:hypothetical protein